MKHTPPSENTTSEVLILAGGLGTRLRPLINDRPKPLAPIGDRPFLAWLLDKYAQQKIQRVCLAVGYMADMIMETIGDTWQGMEICYSIEETPLGTGGATRQALDHLHGQTLHLCNGDTWLTYSPQKLETITQQQNAQIGIALAHVHDVSRYGAVSIKNELIGSFQEKGQTGAGYINGGAYFLSAKAIETLKTFPKNSFFSLEQDFLYPMTTNKQLAAFIQTSNFIDIGVPEDYLRAKQLLPSQQ